MARNQFMSSSNPFMSEKSFTKSNLGVTGNKDVMTVKGAVTKTFILTFILMVSAIFSVNFLLVPAFAPYLMPMMYGSIFSGFILVLLSYWKPKIAPITAPLYAVVEGIAIGLISAMFAAMVDDGSGNGFGIIFNALMLTALCLVSMLGAYKFGLIKATKKFRSMIVTATGAIMLIYLVNMGLSMFGASIPFLHQGGMMGIGISVFIIGIATLNLILDFDNIERGANAGAPKHMEWVTSLGLLVTLVWIYIEILRLLTILNSGD